MQRTVQQVRTEKACHPGGSRGPVHSGFRLRTCLPCLHTRGPSFRATALIRCRPGIPILVIPAQAGIQIHGSRIGLTRVRPSGAKPPDRGKALWDDELSL